MAETTFYDVPIDTTDYTDVEMSDILSNYMSSLASQAEMEPTMNPSLYAGSPLSLPPQNFPMGLSHDDYNYPGSFLEYSPRSVEFANPASNIGYQSISSRFPFVSEAIPQDYVVPGKENKMEGWLGTDPLIGKKTTIVPLDESATSSTTSTQDDTTTTDTTTTDSSNFWDYAMAHWGSDTTDRKTNWGYEHFTNKGKAAGRSFGESQTFGDYIDKYPDLGAAYDKFVARENEKANIEYVSTITDTDEDLSDWSPTKHYWVQGGGGWLNPDTGQGNQWGFQTLDPNQYRQYKQNPFWIYS